MFLAEGTETAPDRTWICAEARASQLAFAREIDIRAARRYGRNTARGRTRLEDQTWRTFIGLKRRCAAVPNKRADLRRPTGSISTPDSVTARLLGYPIAVDGPFRWRVSFGIHTPCVLGQLIAVGGREGIPSQILVNRFVRTRFSIPSDVDVHRKVTNVAAVLFPATCLPRVVGPRLAAATGADQTSEKRYPLRK